MCLGGVYEKEKKKQTTNHKHYLGLKMWKAQKMRRKKSLLGLGKRQEEKYHQPEALSKVEYVEAAEDEEKEQDLKQGTLLIPKKRKSPSRSGRKYDQQLVSPVKIENVVKVVKGKDEEQEPKQCALVVPRKKRRKDRQPEALSKVEDVEAAEDEEEQKEIAIAVWKETRSATRTFR